MRAAPRRQSIRSAAGKLRAWGSSLSSSFACELLEERRLLSAVPASVAYQVPTGQPAAEVASTIIGTPHVNGSSSPYGLSPAQIKHAYGIDQIKFANGTITGDGAGQTIAIIVGYDNPNIISDLNVFSNQYGLPQFNTVGGPTFAKVGQSGGAPPTTVDPTGGFTMETALDVEWTHAIAPKANILLVEANDASFANLVTDGVGGGAVVWAARQPGVSVITMSFGTAEFPGETGIYDAAFVTPSGHAGVSFVTSAGDNGSPVGYPATSPTVMAVGGTTMSLDASNNITGEVVWHNNFGSSGGGLSDFESQPSYQSGFVPGSTTKRGSPDVAFDGDPNTGVSVYDTYTYGSTTGWIQMGGTSLGSPAWASLVAIANQGRRLAGLGTLDAPTLLSKIYSMPASNFHDVTAGGNGLLNALPGYDLVTGRGTPIANLVVSDLIGASSISGQVFVDSNGNAALDSGEAGLSGWTVYQDLNNNAAYDAPTTTNLAGPGKSIGVGTTISNITFSGPTTRVVDVSVTINSSFASADNSLAFTLIAPGNIQIPLSSSVGNGNFTNLVFDDSAARSILNAGNGALNNLTFQSKSALTLANGIDPNGIWQLKIVNGAGLTGTLTNWTLSLSAGDPSTTSSSTGAYQFSNLVAGAYKIREVLQASYTQTTPVGGSYTVNLGSGSNSTTNHFGNQVPVSSTPTGVTLVSTSDSGASSTDRITNVNQFMQFNVSGTVIGSTVTLYFDGVQVGSATALGTTTTVSTGIPVQADGVHTVTARQTQSGQLISAASPALSITIDTQAPVATITPVSPNPHAGSISQMSFTFNEQIAGLSLNNLTLTRDFVSQSLTGKTLTPSADLLTWSLSDLSGLTNVASNFYQFSLNNSGGGLTDMAGNPLTASVSTQFGIDIAAPVVDLNGSTAGTGSSTTWADLAPVLVAPSATVADADTLNIASVSLTITNPSPGDVLSAAAFDANITGTFANNTLTLSGTASPLDYQHMLQSVLYDNTLGGASVGQVVISVVANDGLLNSNSALSTITINNTGPKVDLGGPGTAGRNNAVSWGGAAVNIADATATITDSNDANLQAMQVWLPNPHAGDVLAAATSNTNITATFDGATLNLSGADTVAHYQQVLRSVTYNNTNGGPGASPVTVNVIAFDGALINRTATTTITIAANPPTVDLNGGGSGTGFVATWAGTAPVTIANSMSATLADLDGGNLASLLVQVDNPHTGDVLTANVSGTSITKSFAAGTLTLSGSDTLANYQQVLRSVTYTNTSSGPGVSQFSISVVASDGALASNTAVATVKIPPVVRLNAVNGANFVTTWYNNGASPSGLSQGEIALANVAQATVAAPSGMANLTSMTVVLTTYHAGDVLSVPILAGTSISATYAGGTLTLTGNDTLAHYQQELRLLNYNNTNNGPSVTQTKVTVTASDGTLSSNSATSTINISLPTGTQVLGNRLFYNNSRYDGHTPTGTVPGDALVNSFDDAAIAPDKIGYSGTGTATFANVSSFSKGITGIMVDVVGGIGNHGAIDKNSGDITFLMAPTTIVAGTYNQLGTWTAAPAPTSISVRLGAGVGGSDRIEITWAASVAVKNTWLAVNVHAGGNTGLSANDIFFFGSEIGNSGLNDPAGQSKTEAFDGTAPTTNTAGLTTPLYQILDYNRDAAVNSTDSVTASSNNGALVLYLGSVSGGPFAPGGAPAGTPAVVMAGLPTALPAIVLPSLGPVASNDAVPAAAPLSVAREPAPTTPSLRQVFSLASSSPAIWSTTDPWYSGRQNGSALDEHLLDLLVTGRRGQVRRA